MPPPPPQGDTSATWQPPFTLGAAPESQPQASDTPPDDDTIPNGLPKLDFLDSPDDQTRVVLDDQTRVALDDQTRVALDDQILPPPVVAPAKKKRWLLVCLIGLAVVLVGVGLAIGLPRLLENPVKPEAIVQTYLEALAAGDAEAVLALTNNPPEDQSFLTNAVLTAAMKNYPLTDISIKGVNEYADTADVTAAYHIGTNSISEHFILNKTGGTWYLKEVANTLDLSSVANIPQLSLDGIRLNGKEAVTLFPGHYLLTSEHPYYKILYGDLRVEAPNSWVDVYLIKAELTDTGQIAAVEAAKQHLSQCLEQHLYAPPGCGFSTSGEAQDGVELNESTIAWKVTSGDISKTEFELRHDDPNFARGFSYIAVSGEIISADETAIYGTYSSFSVINVNLSDPADLTVEFEP